MLLACRDGDETGNQRGWISAKFLALAYDRPVVTTTAGPRQEDHEMRLEY